MSSVNIIQGGGSGAELKIGIVTSLFNLEVTERLEEGALKALHELGVNPENIIAVRVPGAFEVPLASKVLIYKNAVDGVVALGAVIKGETSHFDYVCAAAERGCSQLALESGKPVGFGVLTTENTDQALDRAGGSFGNKGFDTASAVVEMCNLLKILQKKV